jgi:gliding motility-associated-like protein
VNPRTGCADTITQTVTIAFVNAAYTSVDSLCITNTANFTDGSIPSSNSTISSWNWNFGDVGSGVNNTSTLQNPSHIFSYPGTYTVSLIVNTTPYGCADTIRKPVKVLGIPLVNANDTISCANIGSVGVLGTILNAPGGTWTSLTGGSFSPNANVLNPNYTPTTADTTAGYATLILTSAGNTMCPGVSDTMRINFYDGPTAIAGTDHYVCADTTSVPLTGSVTVASGGTWTPIFGTTGTVTNPNSLTNALFIPSPVDIANGMATLLLTTTGNGNCIAAKDTVRIFFANPPAATAVLTDTSCVTQPFNVSGTSSTGTGIWYTSGTGTFTDSSQVNTTYTPSGADALAGTVTIYFASTGNNGCKAAVDSMQVTLLPAPLAVAGNDTSICLNNLSVSLNGQVYLGTGGTWSSPGGGTFNPNNTTLNPVFIPSAADTAAGFATVILTGQGLITGCPANSDTLIVTFTPGPVAIANAGLDTIFVCNDTSSVPLNGSVTIASGGSWTTTNGSGTITNPGSLNTTYIPSASDITTNNIQVILTTTGNGFCLPNADTVIINFFSNPVVTVSAADDSICISQTINVTSSSTTGSGIWTTNGTGTFAPADTLFNVTYIPSLSDTGVVTLYFNSTNNNGCRQVKDSININVLPGPLAILGPDTAVCNTNIAVQLSGNTAYSSGYNWTSPGGGTFTPSNSLTPVFTPSASDTAQGFAMVYLTPIGLVLNCPASIDSIRIDLLDPPVAIANATGDTIKVCKDTAFVPLNGVVLVATGGTWTNVNGTGVIANSNSLTTTYTPSVGDVSQGSVTLVLSTTGTIADCSNDQDTVVISFLNDAIVSATMNNDSICSGSAINISGSSSTGGGYWTSSGTGYFTPNDSLSSTTYVPSLSDAPNVTLIYHSLFNYGCREVTDTVILNVVPGPTAAFTSTSGCLGQPINYFDASTPSALVNSWQWTLGSGQTSTLQNPTDTISTLTTQTVTLVVGTALGCTDTVTQTVNVNNPPNADFTVDDWILAMNQQANFTNLTPNTNAWTWFFGDNSGTSTQQNPSYSYPIGGIYPVTLIVTDLNGCMDTVIKEVTVVLPPVVPTGFSPNGDGSNDIFYPRGGPFTKMHMRIYNNWGELIFETHELTGGWDGTYKGVPQPLGVYVWVVDAENENGDTFHDSGDVTLLR